MVLAGAGQPDHFWKRSRLATCASLLHFITSITKNVSIKFVKIQSIWNIWEQCEKSLVYRFFFVRFYYGRLKINICSCSWSAQRSGTGGHTQTPPKAACLWHPVGKNRYNEMRDGHITWSAHESIAVGPSSPAILGAMSKVSSGRYKIKEHIYVQIYTWLSK